VLRRLRLTSFRCHTSLELEDLGPRVLLTGANGRGKTTLLESVGLLARLRSFRTKALRDCTQHGAEGWRVEGAWADEAGPVRLGMVWRGNGRELEVDGRADSTVNEFWGRAMAVVAHGGDTVILEGGSAERRAGFDLLLAEIEPSRLGDLRQLREVVSNDRPFCEIRVPRAMSGKPGPRGSGSWRKGCSRRDKSWRKFFYLIWKRLTGGSPRVQKN